MNRQRSETRIVHHSAAALPAELRQALDLVRVDAGQTRLGLLCIDDSDGGGVVVVDARDWSAWFGGDQARRRLG